MPDLLDGLDVYLVGGAVRDQLLGLPVKDRDWVVVGSTPTEMESRGFKSIGREFPVFLHPHTKEEYALARTEHKTGPGYRGFEFNTSPQISLEHDLLRRDLTINAIAQTPDGTYIDPAGGRRDLQNRILRHVSPAFSEDPVRILRVARFRARFGFRVAAETLTLMKTMVRNGEVDALVAERIWLELRGALRESKPSVFFETLRDCGALSRIIPEVDGLFGVPQNARYHPEIDSGVHTMMVVDQAAKLSADPRIRFAALTHDLGKALTPKEQLPSHRGHEQRGLQSIVELCQRLRIPNDYRDLALICCDTHLRMHRIEELKPATALDLLQDSGAFSRPQRLHQVLTVCAADYLGRKGYESRDYHQQDIALAYFDAAQAVDAGRIADRYKDGQEIARQIREARCAAIRSVKSNQIAK